MSGKVRHGLLLLSAQHSVLITQLSLSEYMCRFAAYLGSPLTLARVISEPVHSLIVQSYRPAEMTSGTVNVDGFGVGWYNRAIDPTPCVYTNICPIWSDRNLPGLSQHITSDCIFANVRSATPGQAVDQSNCQPFSFRQLLFMHNGYIEHFRSTLMRPIRDMLHDEYYTAIGGSTDSEHIFALFLQALHEKAVSAQTLTEALAETLERLTAWAKDHAVRIAVNVAITDGACLIASRFANSGSAPSLYYASSHPFFSSGTLVASEPLFPDAHWQSVAEDTILTFTHPGTFVQKSVAFGRKR